ncbi:MAG: hypothetical protein PUP46_06580 [Endozoicomonas sp. (ex Botrylloides leachii)]|nr:hypothetical protein [Endozoicomonas sp. (ex Botrylloides leachii)]
MSIKPVERIMKLCQDNPDILREKKPSLNQDYQLKEASFVNLCNVRVEQVIPFLSGIFYKEQQQEPKKKIRRVKKKYNCPKILFHKRQHEPNDQENRRCDYI